MICQSGIYKITNIINGKIYVGSAVNLITRQINHFSNLRKCKHCNILLQRAFNKYGEENFIFEILEEVKDKTKLLEREQYYLDLLGPKYNICKIAGSALGRKWTEQSRIKLSNSKKGCKNVMFGKPSIRKGTQHTNEMKLRISNKLKGNKQSDITKQLKSEKRILYLYNNPNNLISAVIQFDKNTGKEITTYSSINEAFQETKITNISACCRNKIPSAGGYVWQYLNSTITQKSRK